MERELLIFLWDDQMEALIWQLAIGLIGLGFRTDVISIEIKTESIIVDPIP